VAAVGWRSASQAFQGTPRILCLRPVCPLSADNADALVAVVGARVRAAAPPPWSVVLDLSALSTLPEGVAVALMQLGALLQDREVSLRLVLPGAQARAEFATASADGARDTHTVHPSARAAMLAAYACLPGAVLVTPALRQLFAQPPELLPLPDSAPRNGAG
jgi:hypothetical protein